MTSTSLIGQDLTTATYEQRLNIIYQETNAEGIILDKEGSQVFVLGRTGNISIFSLSTAYDLSTASYVRNVSLAAQDAFATGIRFNADGTKLFMIGRSKDHVNEYNLESPYDVGTLTYSKRFSIKNQESTPNDLAFNSTGTKLYVIGTAGDDINEYELSAAYDISTATYKKHFSIADQDTGPTSLIFNSTDSKMYVLGNAKDKIYEYTLATPGDISTASFVSEFSVKAQENKPTGIWLNAEGHLFIVGKGKYAVSKFSIEVDTTSDPDKDGDGLTASEDCNDEDANLTIAGANCDDGDATTTNDLVTEDCICKGTITDPDKDADGVPASEDCNDEDANLTIAGASCDDGNATTTNDLVTLNCTCEGTPTAPIASVWTEHEDHVSIDKKVLIGKGGNLSSGYGLYVSEGILAEKVKLALTTTWPDFVFEKDYPLTPLQEVEAFLKEHKHLPNVPSAKELQEKGVDLMEMNTALIRQIEELWLHVIQLRKDNENMQTVINENK